MKSLNLADLDDVEMIMAVESAFDVRFEDKLLQQCDTVGGIFFGIVALFIWLCVIGGRSLDSGSFLSIGVFWGGISLLAVGTFLYSRDQGVYSYATVGDCAKLAAYSNLQTLIKEGAGLRENSLWEAFCWVIAEQTRVNRYKIKLETKIC